MDSFVPFLHHFNHLQTHCLALQLCMPRIQPVSLPDVLYRLEIFRCQHALSTCTKCLDFNNSTLSSSHHNYPHMPRRNNTVHWSKETHPYIMAAHSLQCYITKFFSTPTLWRTTLRSKYIFGHGKPKHDKYIMYEFCIWQHLEWESATTLGPHTLSSDGTTLQTHGQRHSTHYTVFTWRVNSRYRFNLDTVFTYRSLCNGYRIAYTSRFGDILLLFLLVLTWQISAVTSTTRYHMIYNYGWWCRGSTHLEMRQQGLTACKTLYKSWPTYRTYTYMDGELM